MSTLHSASGKHEMNHNELPVTDLILEALPYPVLMLEHDNTICFANLACQNFFQTSIANLKSNKLEFFVPFGSPALEMVERVRLRMAPIHEYKINLSSPRIGKNAIVDVIATPVNDMQSASGASADSQEMANVGRVVVIFQKRAIADKIDRQLTHRGAARTVTGMASMLAHEIKNPLSGIRGAAQLLEASVDEDDQSLTQLITQETDRIVKLVDRMEVFSDETPPQRDPINIHSVLEHVRNLAVNGFGAKVTFCEAYDPSLPAVLANRDQLVQVFINLIKNACEAMDGIKDPQVTLKTAYRAGIKIASPGSNERVSLPLEFLIEDNGNGISSAISNHVFDPFVTTKSSGSGLGLALVSKIITDHGGIIEIESITPGTRVRILMPAS